MQRTCVDFCGEVVGECDRRTCLAHGTSDVSVPTKRNAQGRLSKSSFEVAEFREKMVGAGACEAANGVSPGTSVVRREREETTNAGPFHLKLLEKESRSTNRGLARCWLNQDWNGPNRAAPRTCRQGATPGLVQRCVGSSHRSPGGRTPERWRVRWRDGDQAHGIPSSPLTSPDLGVGRGCIESFEPPSAAWPEPSVLQRKKQRRRNGKHAYRGAFQGFHSKKSSDNL